MFLRPDAAQSELITLILAKSLAISMSPSEAEYDLGQSEDLEDIDTVKKLLELQSHLRERAGSLESGQD